MSQPSRALASLALILVAVASPNRSAAQDCDLDGINDALEIDAHPEDDCDGDGILDSCALLPLVDAFTRRTFDIARGFGLLADPVDVNGDGLLDLVASGFTTRGVALIMNRGQGVFALSFRFSIGQTLALEAADLDDDGQVEIVVTDGDLGVLHILRTTPDGEILAGERIVLQESFVSIAIGDLDDDGRAEILLAGTHLEMVRSSPAGEWRRERVHDDIAASFIEIEDFDGDDLLDVVVGNVNGTLFFAGHGDGSLDESPVESLSSEMIGGGPSVCVDLDGDGESRFGPRRRQKRVSADDPPQRRRGLLPL